MNGPIHEEGITKELPTNLDEKLEKEDKEHKEAITLISCGEEEPKRVEVEANELE